MTVKSKEIAVTRKSYKKLLVQLDIIEGTLQSVIGKKRGRDDEEPEK